MKIVTEPGRYGGMMRLSVDDFPEVAVAEMHQVHVDEVAMINQIYSLLEALEGGADNSDDFTQALDALLQHTREHFANEERLMQQCGFPPYAMHKGAHDLFLEDMQQVVVGWKADQQISPLATFLRLDLPDWMKNHINTMDFVTAGFIVSHS